ncbi:type II toxin-antitoxin system VapC family toxin [Alloalcanivorax venustensis]|uniref:Ribonuclease VapC n=1 Tax=Alloalcanivorax venustensis ISO4 TaxID=1177184 RepID=A0ABS0ACW4_9GAMM|nr:type II toxin-antitoxin system VapC family toxin [Alloalcanivorax venustensis]MBF5051962.1 PilT protein domain-containing protein [Alloalcanivorax venustensis ISO4]
MIVYLDTSAFLKLYLDEDGGDRTREAIDKAGVICTHLITYVEMRAALARAHRMQRITDAELIQYQEQFERDWITVRTVNIDIPMVRRAGELAARHGLRGYDSVHLAGADRVRSIKPIRKPMIFAAFDKKLLAAAQELGLSSL